MIIKTLVVGPFATNCYIVGTESAKDGILIDPGDEATKILNELKDMEFNIEIIVLTHGHIDHVGALKEIKEVTGAEVAIHGDDTVFLMNQSAGKLFGLSYPDRPAPDKLLKDGDSIDIGNLHFQVIHTPGHTPGGICLLSKEVLFSGDTLFNQGIGRHDLPGGDHKQLINSILTKLMILPDTTVIYSGHGPHTTIGAERRNNPFLHI